MTEEQRFNNPLPIRLLSEALRLLKWAQEDFDKYRISNDNWRDEVNYFFDEAHQHQNKDSEHVE